MSTAPIITIPHPALRQTAAAVTSVTTGLKKLLQTLGDTLKATKDPTGVGLAALQINQLERVFATRLEDELLLYINPVIIDHAAELTLGENSEEPDLEGCLSIPRLYGAVPRWQWVDLESQAIDGDRLQSRRTHLTNFAARVAQHELDHLNGVLFIDHCIKNELPIYEAASRSDKMTQLDPLVVMALYQQTFS